MIWHIYDSNKDEFTACLYFLQVLMGEKCLQFLKCLIMAYLEARYEA